ncbi:SDR family oxidoreductase [Pseudooceanicola sp. GBMRC 2024]|uniref:SDR family oxidoreductase n=1 Tax=Pseudooceanicola albus TaxID=2692189 RepID=A0A6L7G2V2_9RHOB|nr:SDR family oxidoreductase [Pseudooceanicola albus]MXN17730.1 SDR family oxidoreductase [Pseudooceanicola albus]
MPRPVLLITGALSGIGHATALAAARAGHDLILSGRNETAGQALVTEVAALGAGALFRRCDVRHEAEVAALLEAGLARFGRLDGALNNAGTEGTPGPLSAQDEARYRAVFDTNVLGLMLSLKHELAAFRSQSRGGAVVNLSSTFGGLGAADASVYAASKHAVEGFTKSVALEAVRDGVRVNAVAPGLTDTAMLDRWAGTAEARRALTGKVPMARIADPAEIAATILFLLSDAASYITGQVLRIDGGETA